MSDVNFIQPSSLAGKKGTVVACKIMDKPDVKNVNGLFIPTGYRSYRTALTFADGTRTRTKSKHFVTVFGNLPEMEPITDEKGNKGLACADMNRTFEFFTTPTEYANGKTYDVIDAREVE